MRKTLMTVLMALTLACSGAPTGGTGGGSGAGGGAGGAGGAGGSGGGTANPCGNGTLETTEACEGFELRGKTCTSEGFDKGTLSCASNCTLDTTGCQKCGDGKISGTEQCDGTALAGKTCASTVDAGAVGELFCSSNCASFDTSNCRFLPQRDEKCSITVGCAGNLVCDYISGSSLSDFVFRCQAHCDFAAIGGQGTCAVGEGCRDSGVEIQGSSPAPPKFVECPAAGCTGGYSCNDAGQSTKSYCGKQVGICLK